MLNYPYELIKPPKRSERGSPPPMPIYQVSRFGDGFTVMVDGVPTTQYTTRGAAVKAALQMKENNA